MTRPKTEASMCEKCADLDKKIARCHRLGAVVSDKMAVDGIQVLLQRYLREKLKLHPEQKK